MVEENMIGKIGLRSVQSFQSLEAIINQIQEVIDKKQN